MLTVLCRKYSRIISFYESNYSQIPLRCYSEVAVHELTSKVTPHVTPDTQHECIARVITPLWQLPYPEQLKLKWNWAHNVLKIVRSKFMKEKIRGKGRIANCKVHRVEPSPVTEAYRNKDEFNIRTGIDGNPKTVGFFVGSPVEGSVVCVRGTHLVNMRQSHKQAAQAYEDYVRTSPLQACHDFWDGGHWRSLVVRSNEEGKLMAIAVFHPQDMLPERVDEEAEKLREYFLNGPGSECNLTSLYFQSCQHTRCTADQAPFKLLLGEAHVIEKLGDYKFQISPDSFFQVNTAAASVLYNTALNLANLSPMTTLLDVCSGTGTISILASNHVRGAVGVESVYSAVTDARQNALLNCINNVEFIPGLAEKKIPKIIEELGMASDIIAIVNPGRSGT
ncbi:hypothetical protein L9F63_020525, partial [Diploptera punctata]